MDVGAVDRRVTARTTALPQEKGMVHFADDRAAGRPRNLGVTFETEIGISLDQQLVIHGTMGLVAGGAAFAQGLVFVDKVPRLFPMTLRA